MEESIILISGSARKWTHFAEILKDTVKEHEDDCLKYINLNDLYNIALQNAMQEELLFKKLSKIKV